jgi:hypothetical protein
MFGSSRKQELAALAPLLAEARKKSGAELREWLDDLRQDAPVTMARIEALLAAERTEEMASPAVPTRPSRAGRPRRAIEPIGVPLVQVRTT